VPDGFVPGGLSLSDETKQKLRGKKHYNNGIKAIKLSDDQEVPDGFVPGMLEETGRKIGDRSRGRKFYNNGTKNIFISDDQEVPEGFVLGRLV
jgi:hypothetical protein